jgi:hypothetical protein
VNITAATIPSIRNSGMFRIARLAFMGKQYTGLLTTPALLVT